MAKKTLPPPERAIATPQTQRRQRHQRLKSTTRTGLRVLGYSVFWIWNLSFLLLLYAFILPVVGIDLVRAVFKGSIETEMLITLVGLMGVPTFCTIVGGVSFWRSPTRLIKLFLGLEVPLMLLLSLRLGVLRELTDASYFLLGTFSLSILAYAVTLWLPNWGQRNRWLGRLQGAIHSLIFLVGLYVCVLMLIYTIPSGILAFRAVFLEDWLNYWWYDSVDWWYFLQEVLLLTVVILSAALFLMMPIAFGWLYCQDGRHRYQQLIRQQGRGRALIVVLGTLMAWCVIFGGVNRQPQQAVFAQLEQATTPEAQAAVLNNEEAVRQGLLNAYLQSYRYLGLNPENGAVKDLYNAALDWPRDRFTWIQETHDWLLSPFLYNGERGDADWAAQAYADIFDAPIQKAEQPAILKSLKSTVMLDAANAGVLDIGRKKVWVSRQEVNLEPHENYVDVELYEVYQNQTYEVEEIFYGFTLPKDAVITGVWLGETGELSDRYVFQVSPRGAAQKVYNSQVQRVRPVDPALLEQVGPDQYRLRAFPIPTPLTQWEQQAEEPIERPTEMHLWLTYRAVPNASESLLPSLTEARNVFWTSDTERIRNGNAIAGFDSWFEDFEDTDETSSPVPNLPAVTLAGYDLTATPVQLAAKPDWRGQELAVLLDTSYSMGKHQSELQNELDWLRDQGLLDGDRGNGEADLYTLTAGETQPQRVQNPDQFTADQPLFYGTIQLKDMIRSWEQLPDRAAYQAFVLLSDEGSYELVKDGLPSPNEQATANRRREIPLENVPTTTEDQAEAAPLPTLPVPLWTVHLGNLPAAYDDATLKAIQDSQGSVARSLQSAFHQWQQQAELPDNQLIVGNWRWNISPNSEAATTTTGLEPIAARVLIHYLAQDLDATRAEALDELHTVAKEQAIVTPYSSMIVLVNDEQRQALKEAEESSDRFNRTVEDGSEELQQPPGVLGGAVPEPGFWVGTLVATGFFVLNRRRRRAV